MTDRANLMAHVCQLYHRDHLTMSEIGRRLGISRHLAGRLLKEAIRIGVVRIEIRLPSGEDIELKSALMDAYGLKDAFVAEVNAASAPERIKQAMCQAAAPRLREMLEQHRTIGVGWGSTTFELINQLEPLDHSKATVVQITGGNKRLTMRFDCHEVTRRLAQKLHVEPVLLHAPGIVDDRRTRELLMRESAVVETFRYFDRLDLAIIGIGAVTPSVRSTLVSSGYVSSSALAALKRAGAVGDVFSYFLDREGAVVRTEIYDRLITIGLPEIRRIKTRLGVACGEKKAPAVAAAIRGGFVNTLIVDSSLARALLALNATADKAAKSRARKRGSGSRKRDGARPRKTDEPTIDLS